jgi:predicted SnoaL-like aldol condensation-catalyzing enzyme
MFINTAGRFICVLACGAALVIFSHPVRADRELTERNKGLVRDFYTTVLIGRDVSAAPRFLRTDYIQHNPQVATGLKGFMDTFRARFAQKLPDDYKRELLNVIGEVRASGRFQRVITDRRRRATVVAPGGSRKNVSSKDFVKIVLPVSALGRFIL